MRLERGALGGLDEGAGVAVATELEVAFVVAVLRPARTWAPPRVLGRLPGPKTEDWLEPGDCTILARDNWEDGAGDA